MGFHRRTTCVTSRRKNASGSSRIAARADRDRTTIAGSSSLTATLMNRYGMPQAIPSAANRISPRRVTRSFWSAAADDRVRLTGAAELARYPANPGDGMHAVKGPI